MKPTGIETASGRIITTGPREKAWRKRINLLLVLFVSAMSLWLALRNVDASHMWRQMRAAKPAFLVLAVSIGAVTNVVRAVRWRVLLGCPPAVGLRHLYTSMMIGYMANNLLPARMGEFVRIHVLARKAGVRMSASAATIILERTIDALVLIAVIGLVAIFLPLPDLIRRASQIAATIVILATFSLFLLARRDKRSVRTNARAIGRSFHGLGHKVGDILEHFVDGLSVLRNARQLFLVVVLTLTIWGIEAVSLGFVIKSISLSLPWLAPLFLLVVLSLSFVIPAAPGAVGTYEISAITVLASLAVEKSQAAGLAVLLHAIVYVTSISFGLACLAIEGLSIRELWVKRFAKENVR